MRIIEKIKRDPKLRVISWVIGGVLLWMFTGIFKSSERYESTNINSDIILKNNFKNKKSYSISTFKYKD